MRTLSTDHKYTFYYAIDDNDKLYNKLQTKKKLLNKDTYKHFNKNINVDIQILSTKNIEKGNVVGYKDGTKGTPEKFDKPIPIEEYKGPDPRAINTRSPLTKKTQSERSPDEQKPIHYPTSPLEQKPTGLL